MGSSSVDEDRSPVASRRAAAAGDDGGRPRRVKVKRLRRSPSYLSLRDRDRDRDRDGGPRRRSRSPSRRRARRYFNDLSRSPRRSSPSSSRSPLRSFSPTPSPILRRRRILSPTPVHRRRARCWSDSDRDEEEEPGRRGRSHRREPAAAAPRSCRSRSRTRSQECEDRICCPGDGGGRAVSPPPEEDFYLRIDRPDDLFKCGHCFQLLSSPVYECVDGHVTCAVCHGSTNEGDAVGDGDGDRCIRCGSTEYRRSRAVAGWLKSLRFPCVNHDYGCPAFLARHRTEAHERACHYAPVFCPVDWRCDFPGGPTDALERHVTAVHGWDVDGVRYGEPVHVRARPGPSQALLRAEDGALFYLCARADHGHGHGGAADHGHGGASVAVSMIHIRPDDDAPAPAPAAQFTYEVKTPAEAAPTMQHRIQMQSTVWGTSLKDGELYANPVSVKVPGSMLPREGPQKDSVEVRIVKVAVPPPPAGDSVQRN